MKKITLVLGSGGTRGFAHLGVLKTLEENGIVPDRIIGSSIGAFVGGFFCKFGSYKKAEEFSFDFDWKELCSLLRLDIRRGLIGGEKLRRELDNLFGKTNFEDLEIPLETVATDYFTAQPVYFNKGSLSEGVHASIAFPMIIEPLRKDGNIFWDGGLSDPLPVERAKKDSGVVLAVNLDKYPQSLRGRRKMSARRSVGMAIRSLQHHLANYHRVGADILLEPELENEDGFLDISSFLKKEKGRCIIEKGSEITQKNIELIKEKIEK